MVFTLVFGLFQITHSKLTTSLIFDATYVYSSIRHDFASIGNISMCGDKCSLILRLLNEKNQALCFFHMNLNISTWEIFCTKKKLGHFKLSTPNSVILSLESRIFEVTCQKHFTKESSTVCTPNSELSGSLKSHFKHCTPRSKIQELSTSICKPLYSQHLLKFLIKQSKSRKFLLADIASILTMRIWHQISRIPTSK